MRKSARHYIIAELKRVVNCCWGDSVVVEIEIVNWRSYVARPDLKNVSWIRINVTIPYDHKLHALNGEQRWAWIFLLTEAARQNLDGKMEIEIDCLAEQAKVNKRCLQAALQHLDKAGLIKIRTDSERTRSDTNTNPYESVHYITNVTNERDGTERDTTLPTHKVPRKRGPRREDHIYDLTDEELDLGRKWLEMALAEMPHKASDTKWNAAQFADDIKKVRQAINYTHQQMLEVFNFIASSEFWRPNCCSPIAMLRAKEGGTRKIDTVITRMKNPFERQRQISKELTADPNRPTKSGISLNRIRELQGLPPIEEN